VARLLERETDLTTLAALVNATGNGSLIVIEGSAGIGKTSLLGEARLIATGADARVLTARCGELEQEFAFGVVRQLFEPLLATAAAEERAELFAGAADLAGPLFDVTSIAAVQPAGDVSFAMLHGLYWLAANAALSRPTAVLIDDLHWCDAPSLRWLLHVVRRLEGLPLVLVVATRPPGQAGQAGLLTELLADPTATVLNPSVLGSQSVASLAREVMLAEPDEQFCDACHVATGGNPLYLRALLTTLAADGLAPTAPNSSKVHAVGPEPVARVVWLRLSRLSTEAEALARALAVLGQSADARLAAALADLEDHVAVAASADLASADIVRLEPRLEFTHPIVRASIYDRIPVGERTLAHQRAASLLIETGAEPERAAAHLLLVAPYGDRAVTTVLREAARRALVRGAATAAVAYLRRALEEPQDQDLRAALLSELGLAERGVDLAAASRHLREAIELTEDAETQAGLALECGRALYFGFRNADARDVFMRATERLGNRRSDLRELLQAETMHVSWFEPELYPVAEELRSRVNHVELGGGPSSDLLLAALAYYEARRGQDRALSLSLAAKALRSQTLEHGASFGLYYAVIALIVAGDLDTAAEICNRALSAARRRGDLLTTLSTLTWRGCCALRRGELQNAESDVREGLELGDRTGFPPAGLYTAAFLAEILVERGELEEAEAVLASRGFGRELPRSVHVTFFLMARGKLQLALRRPEPALADFEAVGRIADALDLRNPAYSAWRSGAAAARLALGRADEAQPLAAEELELAHRWGSLRCVGTAERSLALAHQGPEQERRLREAVRVLAATDAHLDHAIALIELGGCIRRANKRRDAREQLRRGVELAHRCGATALAERGNEELAATGARPRNIIQTGPESLTASERRVAHLAAEEMSNKEIAQALFVTVKTVEVHLSNAYRKLDVGSRRQLAIALGGGRAVASVVG
jgi:DNA-binding CsgD family transcriptional regulator